MCPWPRGVCLVCLWCLANLTKKIIEMKIENDEIDGLYSVTVCPDEGG